jgi:hypothetical protein
MLHVLAMCRRFRVRVMRDVGQVDSRGSHYVEGALNSIRQNLENFNESAAGKR